MQIDKDTNKQIGAILSNGHNPNNPSVPDSNQLAADESLPDGVGDHPHRQRHPHHQLLLQVGPRDGIISASKRWYVWTLDIHHNFRSRQSTIL